MFVRVGARPTNADSDRQEDERELNLIYLKLEQKAKLENHELNSENIKPNKTRQ